MTELTQSSLDFSTLFSSDLIPAQIAAELGARPNQAKAAIELLDGGATVPFIARYRKEATGGLDDAQLRSLQDRYVYLQEMQARALTIIKSIHEQGKLTEKLKKDILNAASKQELEDIYLPYKQKRRTKAQIAKEAGLEALLEQILANPDLTPEKAAEPFLKEGFETPQAALDGARDILAERLSEDAHLVQELRAWLWDTGSIHSELDTNKYGDIEKAKANPESAKFSDYFDYKELISRIPSHRALALFRGRSLEIINLKLAQPELENQTSTSASMAEIKIASHINWQNKARAADTFIAKCVKWAWRVKLSLSLERDLFSRLKKEADTKAIEIFAQNLRDVLLAAPAGTKAVIGLDPGIRTGVKVAALDKTGKLLETATIYPHEPRRDWEGSLYTLEKLAQKHKTELIAIGNGTASRETDKLASELIERLNKTATTKIQKIVVSEAGASVYSASEYASKEMPDVDVSLRGAASIARRLQDPLAELVKIEPKSIGIGQYQHDVDASDLSKALDGVVEDCVNAVGIDINTASSALLSRVSGISQTVAQSIITYREKNGEFTNRSQLLKVTGLGAKTFEQSAGFLRIRAGDNPLDNTGVHPESYEIAQKIKDSRQELNKINPENYITEKFGLPTIKDIIRELEKPGRDPRPDFKVARFNEGINEIKDLKQGMILEGTVSNVAQFGAFVDIGVHQDGLIHISQLSNKFIQDAREIVKAGQTVKVKVLEIDVPRKRIALTLKLQEEINTNQNKATNKNNSPAFRKPENKIFNGIDLRAFKK